MHLPVLPGFRPVSLQLRFPFSFSFLLLLFLPVLPSVAGDGPVPDEQVKALKAIYNATDGQNWARKDNWLTSAPVETWYGVTVRGGQVSAIDLSANNLKGQLPADLSKLHLLRELRINDNGLTSIAVLPGSLSRLYCAGNQLKALPALPALLVLDCRRNQIAALPELPAGLRTLDCSKNQLTILPTLPERLGMLDCSSNQIAALPVLPAMLEKMAADGNKLTFKDLEPATRQLSAFTFSFTPQDSVGTGEDLSKISGESMSISADFAGSLPGNRYQWFRNGKAVTEPQSDPFLNITSVKSEDAGVYSCRITNTTLTGITGLTLYRRAVRVTVESTKAVRAGSDSDAVRIYPNPFRDTDALMVLNAPGGSVSLTVIDARGKVVWHIGSMPADRPFTLPAGLNQGTYLVKVKSGDNVQIIRLVKFN